MKETDKTINYEWLTKPTGDPFADVGGYTIKYLSERYPEKGIIQLIEDVAKIYVNNWDAKINAFFLNSSITQPAYKGDKKIVETIKYYNGLINELENSEVGYCRLTGQKTKLFRSGRDNSLLTGSGKFINFHHSFQKGTLLSKEMIIRMFFIPLGSIYVGGKIATIQSNNNAINEFFVRSNCEENFSSLANGDSKGVLKSDYGIPANALFKFIDEMFTLKIKIATDEKNITLTLFHLTNFGASPEVDIYRLPSSTFRFYASCQTPKLKKEWQSFLFAHYRNSKFKGAKYNSDSFKYEIQKKENIDKIEMEDYRLWRNLILENLLNGKPLIKLFLNWGRQHRLNFRIIEIYQKNIQNMKKETLDKIKELALFLTNTDEDSIKKSIKLLDGYKSAYELRRFFLKNIVAKNYNAGSTDSIITMEELVYYLFPDDVFWRDIRDILLFAIYQELHERNIRVDENLLEELEIDIEQEIE